MRSYKWYITLLVCGSVLALFGPKSSWTAGAALVLFLASLAVYVYRSQQGWHDKWYRARALAESIKTATWRYVMRAEPFADTSDSKNAQAFRHLLSELLRQNAVLANDLSVTGRDLDQITSGMRERLSRSFGEAKDGYLRERIRDQLSWYQSKAQFNRRAAKRTLRWIIAAYSVAIILLVFAVMNPEVRFLPIETFAVLASGIVGWSELRRFNELASTYSLTSHEVSIIESRATDISNPSELARFVSDAENAFSREHTQWAARRDH